MDRMTDEVKGKVYAINAEIIVMTSASDADSKEAFNDVLVCSDPLSAIKAGYKSLCAAYGVEPKQRLMNL